MSIDGWSGLESVAAQVTAEPAPRPLAIGRAATYSTRVAPPWRVGGRDGRGLAVDAGQPDAGVGPEHRGVQDVTRRQRLDVGHRVAVDEYAFGEGQLGCVAHLGHLDAGACGDVVGRRGAEHQRRVAEPLQAVGREVGLVPRAEEEVRRRRRHQLADLGHQRLEVLRGTEQDHHVAQRAAVREEGAGPVVCTPPWAAESLRDRDRPGCVQVDGLADERVPGGQVRLPAGGQVLLGTGRIDSVTGPV